MNESRKPFEIAPMLIKIEAVRHKVIIPETATPYSAGVDLRANMTPELGSDIPFAEEFKILMRKIYPTYNFKTRIVKGEVHLAPGERCLIPTGFRMELPIGYEAQIRPRSGLALKHGITLMNTPGTIDADYRGEVGIILLNTGTHTFVIQEGDRIAQMVIGKHEHVCYNFADNLTETQRGEGGYGHTGK